MKQPSQVPVYTDTDRQRHSELRFQLRDYNNKLWMLAYELDKGIIQLTEYTKSRTAMLLAYDRIKKEITSITQ